MNDNKLNNQVSLEEIAEHVMIARGFLTTFPSAVDEQLKQIQSPAAPSSKINPRDMRDRLWISIDNDDSRDLDQLSFAETINGKEIVYVAIADVDAIVKPGSEIDKYAAHNTTSVYAPSKVFPMLPLKLSTDLTSLNENQERCAIVIEIAVDSNGEFNLSTIYSAVVKNHAKLAYPGVSAFIEKKETLPEKYISIPGLAEQIELQDQIAQRIKKFRDLQGALNFATRELQPIVQNGLAVRLEIKTQNRAQELIENLMIAANVSVTRYLMDRQMAVIRRVVKTPKRWDRIVALAKDLGEELPFEPDAKALQTFLQKRNRLDPEVFPDLSLAIIKLIGRGEYIVGVPGGPTIGHFDLALSDYAHTTAPNRRFPDLVMQRLVKSCLTKEQSPYKNEELESIALNCTQKEDDASKVERRVNKSAAAMVMAPQIGHQFKAMVTGINEDGTWVRLLTPPVEGKLVKGFQGTDVGDHLTVTLSYVDVKNGYIDFVKA